MEKAKAILFIGLFMSVMGLLNLYFNNELIPGVPLTIIGIILLALPTIWIMRQK